MPAAVNLALGPCALALFLLTPAGALSTAAPAPTSAPAKTAGGIPLDAPWKVRVYALAKTKFIHPAWGWQHSERNYLLGLELARGDGLTVDTDVLFAAAFLHDMAAFMPCSDPHLEHGACAALQSPAILRDDGFPVAKIPAVQAAERGHMYDMNPGSDPAAVVLHDADSLDFLGAIGAARMLSLTGEEAPSYARAVRSLRSFLADIPPRLITRTARRIGEERAAELRAFLGALADESRVPVRVKAAGAASVPRFCLGCNFAAAKLPDADLTRATYLAADFTGAQLSGASLRQGRFIAANFQKADLRGAAFDGIECIACNFDGAKLDGASFSGAKMLSANFKGFAASVDDAQLRQLLSGCVACNFTDSKLAGRDFSNTTILSADFSRADLRGVRFDGAVLCWKGAQGTRREPACDTMRDAQTSGASFLDVRLCDDPLDGSKCAAVDAAFLRQRTGSDLSGAALP